MHARYSLLLLALTFLTAQAFAADEPAAERRVMPGGELKILGAGLASSFGEAHFSLESEHVQRLPFSPERAVHTAYKHDAFQPRYLVSESLESTVRALLCLTPDGLLEL